MLIKGVPWVCIKKYNYDTSHWSNCINSSPPSAVYMSMNWVSIVSGNGLLPVRRQAITWTNAGLLSNRHMGTNFSEIWIRILSFSFKKIHTPEWRPFCPGGDELKDMPIHLPLASSSFLMVMMMLLNKRVCVVRNVWKKPGSPSWL